MVWRGPAWQGMAGYGLVGTLKDTCYDIETFPNAFIAVFKHVNCNEFGVFECSGRRCDLDALVAFIPTLKRMVGFNNINFDYPIVHALYHGYLDGWLRGATGLQVAQLAYETAQKIIGAQRGKRLTVWDRDRVVPQLDLFKIHHLDNRARSTSLKALQFAMRLPSIVESGVPFGTWLTPEQIDETIRYCVHDVHSTEKFYHESGEEIRFREELCEQEGNTVWMNLSDTSIGKMYFKRLLEKVNPGCTKFKTERGQIPLGEVIFPWISFTREPFRRLLNMLKQRVVDASMLKNANAEQIPHKGVLFDYGAGGLHASVTRERVYADAHYMLIDIDVTSFYPRLAIVNRFYPMHLGEAFCDVYGDLFNRRAQTEKGSAPNKMLKLALNGVFGDSNNQYGSFYDPVYTLKTTINGQLCLTMLVERLMDVPTLRLIQANTDGVTVHVRRDYERAVQDACDWWQWGTALNLERVDYAQMHIRDVNNYVAVTAEGKVKRKGCYEYQLDWWQDPSALVVSKAAEAAMVHGRDPEEFITGHLREDPWDFMLRTKVPRSSSLHWGSDASGWEQVQNVTRYYVGGSAGKHLVKVMPPTAKGNGQNRHIDVQSGHSVQVCNYFDGTPPPDVNLDWYLRETRKLIIK